MATPLRRYSCDSAPQTVEWMSAIAEFLRPYKPLMDAHVVNFFKDRLWELVDEEWMECLRKESVEILLKLPSGFVRDYWPGSLQEFVLKLRSLAVHREPVSHPILHNLHMASLGTVIAQGMNSKKKHEVEILTGVISRIAGDYGAETIIDVGSGQGYLAQVLAFEYHFSVIAIDASLHHAAVTNSRAERIKKHYAARCAENQHLKVPKTVTCHVLSSESLTSFSTAVIPENRAEQCIEPSLVLAGLHACGDLSVNMLRAFIDCERVKALVSISCCYNLLSEESCEKISASSGFPISSAAKLSSLILGKSMRDLACQSAERWRNLTQEIALQNFDVHAFRAAFQMLLEKHFPEVLKSSPSIGRQGKALRRQRFRRVLESHLVAEASDNFPSASKEQCVVEASKPVETEEVEAVVGCCNHFEPTDITCATLDFPSQLGVTDSLGKPDKYMLFKEFSKSGLGRLGCGTLQDADFCEIWKDVLPFCELIGPFWSLRAALGPVVETYILLDRLLFLQEQSNSVEAVLVPIFDPILSPRNMAIIARKTDADSPRL
ncbi:protein RRNAD1 [Ananas comosus]|uniref:Protein RRNAD1 n=1 Tax=Ananas comosus TaxID=4615 RepID=A0A6P5F5V3_ANACO|nr:protein RRNAD1 [Ananas comosus]XP_020091375.1 protein RRNAD1 [Ananas comosus]XP_020091376.1 protein RRNAD1 [Ananas comosus]